MLYLYSVNGFRKIVSKGFWLCLGLGLRFGSGWIFGRDIMTPILKTLTLTPTLIPTHIRTLTLTLTLTQTSDSYLNLEP